MDNLTLEKLAKYLNKDIPNYKESNVEELLKFVDSYEAINLLLQNFLDTKYDFKKCLKELDYNYYSNNPYLNVFNKQIKYKNWSFKYLKYNPYELFVEDDFRKENDEVIPSLGYFSKPFKYLTIFQNNREWMSLKPNEINTMKKDIEEANGNVLVAGLGMAYFTYMISEMDKVKKITVVELDKDVIDLFNKFIIKNIKNKDKIEIINQSFFDYVSQNDLKKFNYIFIDIYRDVSDGLGIYKRLVYLRDKYMSCDIRFWIEKSMKYYL